MVILHLESYISRRIKLFGRLLLESHILVILPGLYNIVALQLSMVQLLNSPPVNFHNNVSQYITRKKHISYKNLSIIQVHIYVSQYTTRKKHISFKKTSSYVPTCFQSTPHCEYMKTISMLSFPEH